MKRVRKDQISEAPLPFSDGLLSARLWLCGNRTVAAVPELGLHCYGGSKSEALFRLFTVLLKYYRQLNQFKTRLDSRGLRHLKLLSNWVGAIESKMKAPSLDARVVALSSVHIR